MSSMSDDVLNEEYNSTTFSFLSHIQKMSFFWKFSYIMFVCELELELEFNAQKGLKQH